MVFFFERLPVVCRQCSKLIKILDIACSQLTNLIEHSQLNNFELLKHVTIKVSKLQWRLVSEICRATIVI